MGQTSSFRMEGELPEDPEAGSDWRPGRRCHHPLAVQVSSQHSWFEKQHRDHF